MAEMGEVALGMATVMGLGGRPKPFPVMFRGYSLADASLLLRSVLRECSEANIKLSRVEVPTALLRNLRDGHLPEPSYLGVQIVDGGYGGTEILFHRETSAVSGQY